MDNGLSTAPNSSDVKDLKEYLDQFQADKSRQLVLTLRLVIEPERENNIFQDVPQINWHRSLMLQDFTGEPYYRSLIKPEDWPKGIKPMYPDVPQLIDWMRTSVKTGIMKPFPGIISELGLLKDPWK
jgi:hypothetical protein